MITYGFSIQGKSHLDRGVVCQDHSAHIELKNSKGWYLGVVADGVGSAAHSDVGSDLAVKSLCEYCQKKIDSKMSNMVLKELLLKGYQYALEKIKEFVIKKEDLLEQYDTTLSAVLFNGEKVIYGHAGDGGILVRQWNGETKPITVRQKGADGTSVRPLRAGMESWKFGIYDEKVASVLLATDGMLDGVFQPVLVNLPSNRKELAMGNFAKNNAYITATEFFMNPYGVYHGKKNSKSDEFIEKFLKGNLNKADEKNFLDCMERNYQKLFGKEQVGKICQGISKYFYAVWSIKNVEDDKSVVCLINERAKVKPQSPVYYMEPDFKWRQECYNALLYDRPMPKVSKDDPEYIRRSAMMRKGEEMTGEDDTEENRKWQEILQKERRENISKEKRLEKYRRMARIGGIVISVLLLMNIALISMFAFGDKNKRDNVIEPEKTVKEKIGNVTPKPSKKVTITSAEYAEMKEIEKLAEDFVELFGSEETDVLKLSVRAKKTLLDWGFEKLISVMSDKDTKNAGKKNDENYRTLQKVPFEEESGGHMGQEKVPDGESQMVSEKINKIIEKLKDDKKKQKEFVEEVIKIYEKKNEEIENQIQIQRTFEKNIMNML